MATYLPAILASGSAFCPLLAVRCGLGSGREVRASAKEAPTAEKEPMEVLEPAQETIFPGFGLLNGPAE